MGKKGEGGFLTPKAIGNRIKAKGLTKLRWYCQMCEKACRDENGFKCHCESESHQRQMTLIANGTKTVVDKFSIEFEKVFIELLSRRYGEKRVKATVVYNDYIQDRHHIHMNATSWLTLTEFVKYLGREGKARVDQDHEGKWWISWINRDPVLLARAEAAAKKNKHELDDREREAKRIEIQQARLKELEKDKVEDTGPVEFQRKEGQKVKLSLSLGSKPAPASFDDKAAPKSAAAPEPPPPAPAAQESAGGVAPSSDSAGSKRPIERESASSAASKKPKMSAMEQIIFEEKERKARMAQAAAGSGNGWARGGGGSGAAASAAPAVDTKERLDHWLFPKIVVKIMNKKLAGGEFYKKKAAVEAVHNTYVAEVKVLESGDVLKIDQSELETVLPAVGGAVLIVNGPHRGCRGELISVDVDNFCAAVKLLSGPDKNMTVGAVEYEDVCKLAS